MSRDELFQEWVRGLYGSEPGLTCRYHTGNLACDRKDDPELDQLATLVLHHTDTEIPIVRPEDDYHQRRWVKGTGEVQPVTERLPNGQLVYAAVKR